jgi:hypothetical protein
MFLSADEFEDLWGALERGRIYPRAVEAGVLQAQNFTVGEEERGGGLSVLEC